MKKLPKKLSTSVRSEAARIAGTDNKLIAHHLVQDLAHCLFPFAEDDGAVKAERLSAAIATVKALAPADPLEAQLIVQLVCTHKIAAEALRRANEAGQDADIYNRHYKRAGKFLNLFQGQMHTLLKYRAAPNYVPVDAPGKMIVEFVHVYHDQAGNRLPSDQTPQQIA